MDLGIVRSGALLVLAALLAACAGGAGGPATTPSPENGDSQDPYAEAVKDLAPQAGVFTVHTGDDRVLYEIPASELGTPFLWVTTLARAQEGTGFGGTPVGDRVVTWERRGDWVLLRERSYGIMAPDSMSVSYGVQAATFPRVVQAFEIEATGPDSSLVVDVTSLFTRDVAELSPRLRLTDDDLRIQRLDPDRSFFERAAAFPENIEVEATLTYEAQREFPFGDIRVPTTVSALVHHSMVKLPDDMMRPRFHDPRVGYFNIRRLDYARPDRVENNSRYVTRYVTRWRLEPSDTAAFRRGELTEPVEPIVFYIGREMPDEYRPHVARGIESWNEAFEAAGFRNAIQARNAPSIEEDPEWSAEDARHSSIRWWPTERTNARGPHVHDPRTGEILEADIEMHGGLLDRYRAMYIAQVGANMGVRAGEVPDSIQAEIVRAVIAHEVGHTLGLAHNMSASDAYPVDSLRSGSFTRRMSVSPSIMDYTRFNYVAQPGDDAERIRRIGPYDRFAVRWGYAPLVDADTPEEELRTLNRWASETAHDPTIAFSYGRHDARRLTEDLGDDPVAATRYGLSNIQRSFEALKDAMAVPGEDFDNLEYMYGQLLSQRDRMFFHVAALIGGNRWSSRTYGQEGTVYEPIPRVLQRRGLIFLNNEGLRRPTEMEDPETVRMFDPFGGAGQTLERQARLVRALVSEDRLRNLAHQAATARDGEDLWSHAEYLEELRGLLFRELRGQQVAVDPWRRNVQRTFVEAAAGHVIDDEVDGEVRAVLRAELAEVRGMTEGASRRAADRETRAHMEWLRARVDEVLEGE